MRYSVFALFALTVFMWTACQNKPAANQDGTTNTETTAPPTSTGVVNVPVSDLPNDPNTMKDQILKDFLATRAFSYKFDSTYHKAMKLTLEIKQSQKGLSEETLFKVRSIAAQSIQFSVAYEEYLQLTEQLDSVSTYLGQGVINTDEARRRYNAVMTQVKPAGEKLLANQIDYNALRKEYEEIFAGANRKASGGK